MQARIFQEPKNAMQSGHARTSHWVLEFARVQARSADPLMGWAGSSDTQDQVRLSFGDAQSAVAYAARNGIDAHVVATPSKTLKIQTYAENFR